MRKGVFFTVGGDDHRRLEAIARDPSAQHKHVWRARIILESANGFSTKEIMKRTGKSKNTVYRWQQRYMEEGVDGLLYDATWMPGTMVPDKKVREVVKLTKSAPKGLATHWTLRAMAERVELTVSTARKIWQAHGLVPHQYRAFKPMNNPAFVDEIRDIAGLYMNEFEHAMVLSAGKKSQNQALGSTHAPLPMQRGHPRNRTHDTKHKGTTTPFAAQNVLDGTVIGQNRYHHRSYEIFDFLDTVAEQLAEDCDVHVILDDSLTCKTEEVHVWLSLHPRWTFHFTPASSVWLNALEMIFTKLTRRNLKHATFNSASECAAALNRYFKDINPDEKPFRCTANPEKIIAER